MARGGADQSWPVVLPRRLFLKRSRAGRKPGQAGGQRTTVPAVGGQGAWRIGAHARQVRPCGRLEELLKEVEARPVSGPATEALPVPARAFG